MSTLIKTTMTATIMNDNKIVEYTEPMFEQTESEAEAPPEKFDPAEAVRMAARAAGWLD
jgi:hypothetical protein